MKTKSIKQAIELTEKQFLSLMKVVYLGNWIANAYRTDDLVEEYESIEDMIFSYASNFGYEKYVDHESTDGTRYYPTSSFEEQTDVHKLHEFYDEENFWDMLAEGLGERDFYEKYTTKEIKKMNRIEYVTKLDECINVYHEEFEEFGLRRIQIQK